MGKNILESIKEGLVPVCGNTFMNRGCEATQLSFGIRSVLLPLHSTSTLLGLGVGPPQGKPLTMAITREAVDRSTCHQLPHAKTHTPAWGPRTGRASIPKLSVNDNNCLRPTCNY